MTQRIAVLNHQEGVFVGHSMGLAFFSLSETAGQWQVYTWATEEQARTDMEIVWKIDMPLHYKPVIVADEHGYATVAELRAAGLGEYIGDLEANFLLAADAAGEA